MNTLKLFPTCLLLILLISGVSFTETYHTVTITADKLNVREDMTIDSPILGTLDQGTTTRTLDIREGWYKINYKAQTAYISSDYVDVKDNYILGTITGKHVNMRDLPSTQNSKILTQLSNTTIKVHALADSWYHITGPDGQNGYVFADFVTLDALKEGLIEELQTEKATIAGNDSTDLITLATSKLGSPYEWAGEGPNTFDCSGFIKYCFQETYGIQLPHSASSISLMGTRISKDQLQAGDLVFFSTNRSGNVNHVGIYIGNGEFIHASSSSYNGHQVHINPINKGFYDEVYKWAQRISIE